jgi:GNAT superfamily N-acetyltransferase
MVNGARAMTGPQPAPPRIFMHPPAPFDDWHGVLALLRAAFAGMQGRIDPPSSLNDMDAGALRAKARGETLLTVYEGARLAGCAFLRLETDAVYIGKIAVLPECQRRGIGRAILDRARAFARQNGKAALTLQTRVELTENHRVFAANGFVEVERTAHPGFDRPTSIIMRCDTGL